MSETHSRLADAQRLMRQNRLDAALDRLSGEIKAASCVSAAHTLQLQILLAMGQRNEAEAAFDRALALPASSADAFDALAFYARRFDRHELSNTLYRRAVQLAPEDAQLLYNLATSERSLGRLAEAAEACRRTLLLAPDSLRALLLRSELVRATSESNHVDELTARLVSDRTDRGQMFVGYALGKELHDLGRFDEAFGAFAHAAAVRRRNLAYDVAEDERKLRRIEQVFTSSSCTSPAMTSDRHIFIVGLPRAGTTLIERILSALPAVRSNGETDNFSTALLRCAPRTAGDIFERCAQASPATVATTYDLLAARDNFTGRIIEKLPLNYLYVGAIASAFPQAPIIWVRRHCVDNCFAMFRTLFGEGYPFSYDFQDLARYYAAYERLMRHWNAVLPGRLIEVHYEQLVADPAAVAADIARRCGLPWSEDALDLSRNRTASLTASAAQVRGSIYVTSAGLWKSYRRHLEPLVVRLRELGVSVPAG